MRLFILYIEALKPKLYDHPLRHHLAQEDCRQDGWTRASGHAAKNKGPPIIIIIAHLDEPNAFHPMKHNSCQDSELQYALETLELHLSHHRPSLEGLTAQGGRRGISQGTVPIGRFRGNILFQDQRQ